MDKNKLNEHLIAYEKLKCDLRIDIIAYLKDVLEVREGKRMTFKDIDEDYGYAIGNVTIAYDGGNHPEYASNAFSEVYGLYIHEDGTLCFDIEDSDCYDVDRIWSIDELISIMEVVNYLLVFEKENN